MIQTTNQITMIEPFFTIIHHHPSSPASGSISTAVLCASPTPPGRAWSVFSCNRGEIYRALRHTNPKMTIFTRKPMINHQVWGSSIYIILSYYQSNPFESIIICLKYLKISKNGVTSAVEWAKSAVGWTWEGWTICLESLPNLRLDFVVPQYSPRPKFVWGYNRPSATLCWHIPTKREPNLAYEYRLPQ